MLYTHNKHKPQTQYTNTDPIHTHTQSVRQVNRTVEFSQGPKTVYSRGKILVFGHQLMEN